eukprot:TRINITY_DN2121_c2_g2_i2.p1 TRINITY_DN2121_c2_g2~~TRINITY_DN2121_c2_g2_i2.p1  ORF type:complete len:431 (-),score=111.50 TRINITY_DN2121_c2_g2_i2:60-1352(-)
MSTTIKLQIKTSVENYEVTVEATSTIIDVKYQIQNISGHVADRQRLIYNGTVLQDGMDLNDYGIKNGSTLHMVVQRSNTGVSTATSNTSTGSNFMGMNTEALDSMMQLPFVQNMFNNPEFLQTVMQNDPQIRRMMDENPELAGALSDPAHLRQMSEIMSNPAARSELLRNSERAMANIENIPGGFDLLARYFGPNGTEDDTSARSPQTVEYDNEDDPIDNSSGPNTQALPNPWAARPANTNPMANMNNMNSLFSMFNNQNNTGNQDGNTGNTAINPMMGFPNMFMNNNANMNQSSTNVNNATGNMANSFNPMMGFPHMFMNPYAMNQGAGNVNNPMGNMENSFNPMGNTGFNPMGNTGFNPMGNTGFNPIMGLPNQQAPELSRVELLQKYSIQLQQMEEMGFIETDKNLECLQRAFGNVDRAIQLLFQDV